MNMPNITGVIQTYIHERKSISHATVHRDEYSMQIA